MITAPLMTSSLKLDLPRAEGATPGDAGAVGHRGGEPTAGCTWGDEKIAVRSATEAAQLASAPEARCATRPPAGSCAPDQADAHGRIAELIGWGRMAGWPASASVTETGGLAAGSAKSALLIPLFLGRHEREIRSPLLSKLPPRRLERGRRLPRRRGREP